MAHPPFPLPEGHAYGPGQDPRKHDGRGGFDGLWLWHAQTALRLRWGFAKVHSTGVLDAATQAAVGRLQTLLGEDPTGDLDARVWDAIWSLRPCS